MDLTKELYEIAKDDFMAATDLFGMKHYSLAIFQLQQSIEKAVKSYGLAIDVIKESDLQRKISHLPHKVFTRAMNKKIDYLEDLQKPLLMEELIPPHQRKERHDRSNIDDLIKIKNKSSHVDFDELSKISEEEINSFIGGASIFDNFEFDEKKELEKIKEDMVKTFIHFKDYFTNVLKDKSKSAGLNLINHVLENPDETARMKMIEYKYKSIIDNKLNFLFYVWFNMSIITSPHEQTTRYPSSENGSPNQYNENHPLVKKFRELSRLVLKSYRIYEELMENNQLKASL